MEIVQIETNKISPYVRHADFVETTNEIFHVPWRIIYDYEFYFVVEGKITVITENEEVTLEAGDVHIMRPSCWHRRIATTHKIGYYNMHFDFLKLEENSVFSTYNEYVVPINRNERRVKKNDILNQRVVYEPKDIALPLKATVKDRAKYISLLGNLVEHYKHMRPGYDLLLKSDILVLLYYLLEENDERKNAAKYHHNAVAQFTQIISSDFSEKLYLSDLSEQTGLSPSQMRKLFREVNSCSPRDYLINLRIEKAKYMLEEGKETVASIGEKVGYENVNYFSRIFKKKTGMSPIQYRESLYIKKKSEDKNSLYWCDVINPVGGEKDK